MMSRRLTLAGWVALLYLLVTSNVQWSNLALASLVGLGLACVLPAGRALRLRELPRAGSAALEHGVRLGWDVFLNGLLVASMVARGRRALRPGFVKVRDRHGRDLASALEAHAITISPGQLVIDFEGEERREPAGGEPVFEVHCLDVGSATDLAGSGDEATSRARLVARIAGAKGRLAREGAGGGAGGGVAVSEGGSADG